MKNRKSWLILTLLATVVLVFVALSLTACDNSNGGTSPCLHANWSDWTVTIPPTCVATGTKTRICNDWE